MSKRRHNFGTKRFKEKSLFIFHARIALKSLILLFVRLIARGARIGKTQTDRHTDRTSTVTLAHARQGLMRASSKPSHTHTSHTHTLVTHTLVTHTLVTHTLVTHTHTSHTHTSHTHTSHTHTLVTHTLVTHTLVTQTLVTHTHTHTIVC